MRPQIYGLVPSCQKWISHCLHLTKEVCVVFLPFARQTHSSHMSNVTVSHSIMTGGERGKTSEGNQTEQFEFLQQTFPTSALFCTKRSKDRNLNAFRPEWRCLNIIFLTSLSSPLPLPVASLLLFL